MSGHKKRRRMPQLDEHLDLVPLIDVVFLLLLFFMLCGRLSADMRTEQITVPPTKTAAKFDVKGWERVILNVFGSTQEGKPPRNSIQIGGMKEAPWVTSAQDGDERFGGYQKLRRAMDRIYDKAEKYPDPKTTPPIMLPKVIVEIRADAETEYRVVQEVQQVLSDTIDPFNKMLPKNVTPQQLKAFVNIDFTTRKAGEKA